MAMIGQTVDNVMRYQNPCADLEERLHGLTHDFSVYDEHVRGLVANLVRARHLQPVGDPILQDIDDAIDALAEFAKVDVLIPGGGV